MPLIVLAEPSAEIDLSKMAAPPEDAPMGEEHKGIQIGLWTERSVYGGAEIRNVWSLTRNDRTSGITTGVGGKLYSNSFLYVTSNEKVVAKITLNGGIDGMVNPTGTQGGLSASMATLPNGVYQLTWKTDTHISNTLTIEIRKSEARGAPAQNGVNADSMSVGKSPPKPGKSPEVTVQNLYDAPVFFGLRSRCRASAIKRFAGGFTPELLEHLTLCDWEAEKWLLENEDTNLK